MARQNKDFLTQIREQTERTLSMLTSEIRRREAELEKLLEQVRLWRDAITNSLAPGVLSSAAPAAPAKRKTAKKTATKRSAAARKKTVPAKRRATLKKKSAVKKSAAKKAAPKRKPASGRVDWDAILAALPATFTIDDVMKDPGARAKGRNQVYPAINRWVKAKKARKVGTGRYKRVA